MEKDLVREIENLNLHLDRKYEAKLQKYKLKINQILGSEIYDEDGEKENNNESAPLSSRTQNPEEEYDDEKDGEPALKSKIKKYTKTSNRNDKRMAFMQIDIENLN